MTKYSYRNISKMVQTLVGYGQVKPNEVITTTFKVENPNFELQENAPEPEQKSKSQQRREAAAAAAAESKGSK